MAARSETVTYSHVAATRNAQSPRHPRCKDASNLRVCACVEGERERARARARIHTHTHTHPIVLLLLLIQKFERHHPSSIRESLSLSFSFFTNSPKTSVFSQASNFVELHRADQQTEGHIRFWISFCGIARFRALLLPTHAQTCPKVALPADGSARITSPVNPSNARHSSACNPCPAISGHSMLAVSEQDQFSPKIPILWKERIRFI